eukprot:GHVS01103688.1.p1 GENE.GHVS01103688.1~~GHVS01103688.1.p1  ORF type:complete len:187 (-),score=23.14 GHVS01103688.1:435-995(-)
MCSPSCANFGRTQMPQQKLCSVSKSLPPLSVCLLLTHRRLYYFGNVFVVVVAGRLVLQTNNIGAPRYKFVEKTDDNEQQLPVSSRLRPLIHTIVDGGIPIGAASCMPTKKKAEEMTESIARILENKKKTEKINMESEASSNSRQVTQAILETAFRGPTYASHEWIFSAASMGDAEEQSKRRKKESL